RQLDETSKKLDTAAKKAGKLKDGFEKAGKALAPLSTASAGGLAASVKIAADLDEQISKTSQVFKTQAKEVDSFTRSAIDNFGMSELSARNIANVY
ncbi:phage tail tape measure protein, partial [Enterococcus faecalis]